MLESCGKIEERYAAKYQVLIVVAIEERFLAKVFSVRLLLSVSVAGVEGRTSPSGKKINKMSLKGQTCVPLTSRAARHSATEFFFLFVLSPFPSDALLFGATFSLFATNGKDQFCSRLSVALFHCLLGMSKSNALAY